MEPDICGNTLVIVLTFCEYCIVCGALQLERSKSKASFDASEHVDVM